MILNLLAVFWAAAEASVFFVVPEVFTSAVALKDPRRGLRVCLWATGGALLGRWPWGSGDCSMSFTL